MASTARHPNPRQRADAASQDFLLSSGAIAGQPARKVVLGQPAEPLAASDSDRQTRDAAAQASRRLQAVLAVEDQSENDASALATVHNRSDPAHGNRQPAVGHGTHPRRAAQSRDLCRQTQHPEISASAATEVGAESNLGDARQDACGRYLPCDFLPVVDVFFRHLYLHFIIELGTRRIVHVGVTDEPDQTWVAQQWREATPNGQFPRFIVRDNDSTTRMKWHQTQPRTAQNGTTELRHPPRSDIQMADARKMQQ